MDPTIVLQLLAQGLIPVVATIGADALGQAFNINADTVAGALAAALGAEKLVFLDRRGRAAGRPGRPAAPACTGPGRASSTPWWPRGRRPAGMIPKVEACARAVRAGVRRAHILDGRTPHALLLELFTDEGVGTMVEVDRDGTAGPTGTGCRAVDRRPSCTPTPSRR